MRAYVAVTDQDWFDYLSRQHDLDEVNFWTPNPWGGEFQVVERGELFLFKLKSPWNAIAGGGFFEHYTELPVSLAWSAFREKNGAASFEETRNRISRLRREQPKPWDDYTIGCAILVDPFFWIEREWIPQPSDWKAQIVRGKSYGLATGVGREIWSRIVDRLESKQTIGWGADKPLELPGGYGAPILRPQRRGQGTFQVVVTDAYRRRCAVTGEKALPVLDAAHIRPFATEPEHYVTNGILLRSDLHRLLDSGYMTINPKYRTEISRKIREDFNDGENYLKLHGSAIEVPDRQNFWPDKEILRWHNENKFRG